MTDNDARLKEALTWLIEIGESFDSLKSASQDVSFRRYFRLTRPDRRSVILMDAPPSHEAVGPFVHLAEQLRAIGVHTPEIVNHCTRRGFVLMEDLGATWLLEHLNQLSANDVLFEKLKPAFDVLMTMQKNGQAVATQLPFYDEALLLKEMRLMPEWFLKTHCGLCLSESEEHLMSSAFEKIVAQLMTQPKGLVHRDFHSRNLMVLDNQRLGVIDFQDAVYGPLSYDWISILKDCYICFPRQQVTQWIAHYHAIWQAHGLLTGLSAHAWLRCCDWMGLQRHIKVLGIFARLHHRDHKSQYLGDLPRVFAYVDEALLLLPELTEFKEWWHARVRPTFERMAQ